MVTLGVSVYPDMRPMSEIRSYLQLAAQYGFTRVFTSVFSIEGTPREVLACVAELNECAHEFGMEVSLDGAWTVHMARKTTWPCSLIRLA